MRGDGCVHKYGKLEKACVYCSELTAPERACALFLRGKGTGAYLAKSILCSGCMEHVLREAYVCSKKFV